MAASSASAAMFLTKDLSILECRKARVCIVLQPRADLRQHGIPRGVAKRIQPTKMEQIDRTDDGLLRDALDFSIALQMPCDRTRVSLRGCYEHRPGVFCLPPQDRSTRLIP
jgi:hypothetical protein